MTTTLGDDGGGAAPSPSTGMRVRRETQRPDGRSISWTQIVQALTCGKRLEFYTQRLPQKDIGIGLIYGRAIHAALATYQKGYAKTPEAATAAAIRALDAELAGTRLPVRWDEPWEVTQAGLVSTAAKNYGRLPSREACAGWLRHQVPLYLRAFPARDVLRSEHRIFVPLTPPRGVEWSSPWSLECWIDLELTADRVRDLKSTDDAWKPQDARKAEGQALVYMGAYYHFYRREPRHFEFHVLPRLCEAAELEYGPAPRVDVHRVEWDAARVQAFIDDVVKPIVTMRDRGIYPANPGSSLCTQKYCGFWDHCRFGGKA